MTKTTTRKNTGMMKRYCYLILLGAALLTSCKTPHDITYLQDVTVNVPVQTQADGYIRFMPGDKLSIHVHSRDEKLMSLFNLFQGSSNITTNSNGGLYAYTVDSNGDIDFPVLGAVRVQGLTRTEVARAIKNMLVKEDLCKDPVVTVTFYDMSFSVLGTVSGAGVKQITKDKITILEAIAMAGDLQIDGVRNNVLVMRREGDRQVPYRVDLTSAESIYNSPVYHIRQNDVVYVEPNDKYKRNSTVMANDAFKPTFWMSLASFLAAMAAIVLK